MVFLDIEKAFDSILYDGLLYELLKLATPVQLVKVIESFLENRKCIAQVENKQFTAHPVVAGVPQGLSLSSIVFHIYTNGMPILGEVKVSLFAVNRMFFTVNKNANMTKVQLRQQIHLSSDYFYIWKLKNNPTKTIAMLYSQTRSDRIEPITVCNTPVTRLNHMKYLGFTIGLNLNSETQVAETVNSDNQQRYKSVIVKKLSKTILSAKLGKDRAPHS